MSSVVTEPIQDQILRQLEEVAGAQITKNDLNDAILKVQEDNDVQMTQAQTRALIKTIFTKADASQTGIVSRSQIRKALNKSIEQVSAL